jgi:dynactin complex subunit
MNAVIQFDLFEPIPDEMEMLRLDCMAEIKASNESLNKVRKKLFAENGALKKRIDDLENRLAILEKNICH